MNIELFEHKESKCYPYLINGEECIFDEVVFKKISSINPTVFPSARDKRKCFKILIRTDSIHLKADYYIGLDWLIENERYVHVKPKLNQQVIQLFQQKTDHLDLEENEDENRDKETVEVEAGNKELNYLKLLMDALAHPEILKETKNLVFIDWNKQPIKIASKDDALTPLLVVQFLNLLKQIVRKGLKKSYYKVQENLNNRVKGKILVGTHIKQNVLKNRRIKTYCDYQVFGIDHAENRFLKNVLGFVSNYIANHPTIFISSKDHIEQLINYCRPAFELVNEEKELNILKQIKHNPFFKEYREAVKIGKLILKRFAYNISKTGEDEIATPPFWINMPQLFELYVYHHLIKLFPNQVKFQFSTYGNALDFLVTQEGMQMVVDAKYKISYQSGQIHEDIRQVSGYARLEKVYKQLDKSDNALIDCLIIYPNNENLADDFKFDLCLVEEIKAYKQVYKIGIPMPYLKGDV